MRTNNNLVQFILDNGLEKQYAYFMKLKRIHVNGRIYNYSLKKLSIQSGYSRSALRLRMRFFIENKWVRVEGKDIVFIGHNSLMKLYEIEGSRKEQIKAKGNSIKCLVDTIRFQPIKLKGRQFSHIKNQRNNLINPLGYGAVKAHRAAKAFFKDYKLTGGVTEGLKISTKKLGLLINKSASTASRLMKEMDVKVIRGKRTVVKTGWSRSLPSNFYWNKGYIVKVESNQYIF